MLKGRKGMLADLPEGGESPLGAAVAARDGDVLATVAAAVRHRQCLLAYQPVVLASDREVCAFHEGLIRVPDATGRIIPAREFMPFIEDLDLGRQIDCAALEMGLKTLARTPNLRLALNMSARSIGYAPWLRTLERALKLHDGLGPRLILDISERSAMTVPELVIGFMADLQPHGIAFALDDFGGGQTAFRHFRDFFFDIVKIDGQFVRGLEADRDNQAVARSLIGVAREFDMFVVAAHVEREEEAAWLTRAGVDCLQGHLIGPPTVRPAWLPDPADRRWA